MKEINRRTPESGDAAAQNWETVGPPAQILWDYLQLNHQPTPADCIIGFGCYNEDIPRRAAQLYHQGYADRILFTGGLGRNTKWMWTRSEAEHFAAIAIAEGVPEGALLMETRSTNTAENILFSRALFESRGITIQSVLGVHKPYMERRVAAAWPVYWPGVRFTVTSRQQTLEEYIASLRGRRAEDTVNMLVGDFQRIDTYADRGYQLRQDIPQSAWEAFHTLVDLGYTRQLV